MVKEHFLLLHSPLKLQVSFLESLEFQSFLVHDWLRKVYILVTFASVVLIVFVAVEGAFLVE